MTTSLDATSSTSSHAQFVQGLTNLDWRARELGDGDARARLARLRRCLSRQGAGYEALREVGAFLPDNLSERYLDAYLLVAALFAHHPASSKSRSLGAAFKKLRAMLSAGVESLDRRFATLLESDPDDLSFRIRQLIQLLKSKEIPVDYGRLLHDLIRWDHPDRPVQRQWARDYWTN